MKKNLTGMRFGRLLVIEDSKERTKNGSVMWICMCDCGNTTCVVSTNLTRDLTRSCGCLQRQVAGKHQVKDLTGKIFGRLRIISKTTKNNKSAWLCVCECGAKTIVSSGNIKSGAVKSCGCLQKEASSLPPGVAAFNAFVYHYKSQAIKRKKAWLLDDKDVKKLTKQNCCYCGTPPAQISRANGQEYVYNGIDRKNNNIGYIKDNCVPCCKTCNIAKASMSYDEFIGWIKKVHKHSCCHVELHRETC